MLCHPLKFDSTAMQFFTFVLGFILPEGHGNPMHTTADDVLFWYLCIMFQQLVLGTSYPCVSKLFAFGFNCPSTNKLLYILSWNFLS